MEMLAVESILELVLQCSTLLKMSARQKCYYLRHLLPSYTIRTFYRILEVYF
jgi:hypothetical protein